VINDDYRTIIAAIFAAMIFSLVMLFITGCETVRFGLETDYGTFSYELPKPTSTK
jgi:hypothetical protein